MEKALTKEYLINEGVKFEIQNKETVFSITGIKKHFSNAFVHPANVIELDGEGKTRKYCKLADVEFGDNSDEEVDEKGQE